MYPKLFCWVEQDGKIYVGAGEKKPNLIYFHLSLLPEDSKHIEKILLGYPPSYKRNQAGKVIDRELEKDGTVKGIYLDNEKYDQFERKLLIN